MRFKQAFLRTISYGALMAAAIGAPLASNAHETPDKTTQDILVQAQKAYDQAFADFGAGKIDAAGFNKAEQAYASVMATHAPEITEEEKANHPLFKNRAPRDLPLKEQVRLMTPKEINTHRAFLQKRLEVAESRLPNAVERGTQTVTQGLDKGVQVVSDVVTTPLTFVEKGFNTAGQWVKDGLHTVSEKTGDRIVAPLVGTVVGEALELTGNVAGSTGRLTDSALRTTSNTLKNTLQTAATATRNPKEAGLNLAADMTQTVAGSVGDVLTEAGNVTMNAVHTTTAVGRQSVDSTLSVATTSLVTPAEKVASLVSPKTADDIGLWGFVGRAGIAGYAAYPAEAVGHRVAESLMGVGQGIHLASELAHPLMRGNAAFVSPAILTDMTQTVQYYRDTKAADSNVPGADFKTNVMMAAALPYTQALEDQADFVHRQGLMTSLRATVVQHGTNAAVKRTMAAQTDYALAAQALADFDEAVKAVQAERTATLALTKTRE